ncbi:MAG TPA: beta-ketoacyl-[acyl-carrier-protein] synthase family protein [Pirellulaceae bacterium]|nr:beta-ketoacyl-[acyl-carrier-protein] synthase family protein [Pirellulaceae bacterium]
MRACPVVITGVGAATPLGADFDTFAANLLAGRSPAKAVTDSAAGVEVRLPACLSDDPPAPVGWDEAEFRSLPRTEQFVLWCCTAALADAGLLAEDGARIGLSLGAGGEWIRRWEGDWAAGGREVYEGRTNSPSLVDVAADRLSLNGPRATVAAACASGNAAIAQARRWIELGLADICLAGGVETITPICRSGFNNLRALSKRVDDARRASRPFDQDRDGFVIGEGAAILVLESSERARRRGARAYAEVAGFGATSDAFHMIIPSSDPAPAAAAMQLALADAAIEPHEIDYINAHATSTPVGDKAEARALHSVFGSHTATTPVSSTKSVTGHLLSAAAAIEALACLVAIREQAIPPTINLERPDPECDLCHVPHQAIAHPVEYALSNSFGFGGSNTSLILRKAA